MKSKRFLFIIAAFFAFWVPFCGLIFAFTPANEVPQPTPTYSPEYIADMEKLNASLEQGGDKFFSAIDAAIASPTPMPTPSFTAPPGLTMPDPNSYAFFFEDGSFVGLDGENGCTPGWPCDDTDEPMRTSLTPQPRVVPDYSEYTCFGLAEMLVHYEKVYAEQYAASKYVIDRHKARSTAPLKINSPEEYTAQITQWMAEVKEEQLRKGC